jgi:hypothetical protein
MFVFSAQWRTILVVLSAFRHPGGKHHAEYFFGILFQQHRVGSKLDW